MNELISKKLEELGIPVQWQLRPKGSFPSLTYTMVNENGEVYTEDGEVGTGYNLQIDVWTEEDYTKIVRQVKNKMEEIEFYRITESDNYEKDDNIYHKVIRFYKLGNNESEGK